MNRMETEVNPGGYIDNHGQPVKESFWAKFKRPIAGLAAGVAIVTGAGAMAEKTTPTVDNQTKIEGEVDSSEASVKDEMPQLPENNSSESTTNTTEDQITAKGGVGDLLNNANGSEPVTNFKAGVEVPGSNGGEVQYASNVTNENGEPVIVPLEGGGNGEVEKSAEQIIAENVVNYLNATPARAEGDIGYTDEDIKKNLIVLSTENTDDLGLIHGSSIQSRLLGSSITADGKNLLLYLGVKDVRKSRFVTAMRVPIYALDKTSPLRVGLLKFSGSTWHSPRSEVDTNNVAAIKKLVDDQIGNNFICELHTSDVSKDNKDKAKQIGGVTLDYIDDLGRNIPSMRSLCFDVYRSGINGMDFANPGLQVWRLNAGSTVDSVSKNIRKLTAGDVSNIPITITLFYS